MKKKIHYAWFILLSCVLMQSGIMGVVQNCRGIFYNPVCTDLGIEVSAFTLYSLFYGIGCSLTITFSTKWLKKTRYPRRILGISMVLFTGSTALMGLMTKIWGFYLMGALQGIGASLLTFYICPLLVANWFKTNYGFAMGVYGLFTGLVGIVVNPILNGIIERSGWRSGYLAQGLSAMVFGLVGILLIKGISPADCGMTPYGESAENASQSRIVNDKSPATPYEKKMLNVMIVFTSFASFVNVYCQHFAKYAVTLGYSSAFGATLVSCSMAGNMTGKISFGIINDRFGTKAAVYTCCATVALGFLGMMFPTKSLLYVFAFVGGTAMPYCSQITPMLTKYLFGTARYGNFYPTIIVFTTLTSALAVPAVSKIYEIKYDYIPVFIVGLVFVAIATSMVFLGEVLKKKGETNA